MTINSLVYQNMEAWQSSGHCLSLTRTVATREHWYGQMCGLCEWESSKLSLEDATGNL